MSAVENLTPRQHTRQALHRAINRIAITWPQALEDADARGYTRGGAGEWRQGGAERDTTVEAAALQPSHAVAWLAELGDLLDAYGVVNFRHTQARIINQMLWVIQHEPVSLSEHTIRQTIRLANVGCQYWPTLAKDSDKPKQYDAEPCMVCKVDAYPGDRRAIKTAAGEVEGYAHKKPCWYTITMSRGNHPRQKTGT
jgi:hypothetical protein